MIKFCIIKTGEVKEAYSAREENDKVYIRFSSNTKEYPYNKSNIQIIEREEPLNKDLPFTLYSYESKCWKCNNPIEILTYIRYDEGDYEDVLFPYDLERLYNHQYIDLHMQDQYCEYFAIKIIGDIPKFDDMLVKKYPNRISKRYSKILNKTYAMNICPICNSQQGKNFVYKDVNRLLQDKIELKKFIK